MNIIAFFELTNQTIYRIYINQYKYAIEDMYKITSLYILIFFLKIGN